MPELEILYIDPFAGASGDMFLGALIDLGVSFDDLRHGLHALKVKGFDLERRDARRHEIACTKVDVVVEDVPHPHRHLKDLLNIVNAAALPDPVKETSCAALRCIAEAEARAHRMPVDHVHLHEVGGLDCLVDVVGTVLGVHLLGVDRVFSAPVSVGSGFVKCAHGVMPEPVPGTLAILEGFPIRRTQIPHEMTTPTGAALIVTLAQPVTEGFLMKPIGTGHGAGTRDTQQVANFLRLVRAKVDARHLPAAGHGHGHGHSHDHHHGEGGDHHHDHGHDHHHSHGDHDHADRVHGHSHEHRH